MMKLIDEGFDDILKVKYELYSLRLSKLRALVRSWYPSTDFNKFNERRKSEHDSLMKEAGIVCNYFFAYKENKEFFLMDGFNRLFTQSSVKDSIVYLKMIVEPLKDNELMKVMLYLNMWKLNSEYCGEFRTFDFFDRGLRLFLYKKFDLNLYHEKDWTRRKRNENDFDIVDYYFRDEGLDCRFKHDYLDVKKLLSHENIIIDLKEIIDSNNYLKKPFNHCDTFLHGFVMFLSRRRVKGDNGEHKFKTYLDLLYKDKFFKKLQKMSWTDSTRKCVYKFFRNIEESKL